MSNLKKPQASMDSACERHLSASYGLSGTGLVPMKRSAHTALAGLSGELHTHYANPSLPRLSDPRRDVGREHARQFST